jgi:PTH1 family peptidyl-tRNA hydrolase
LNASDSTALVVGLGNPGPEYASNPPQCRCQWFVERLAENHGIRLGFRTQVFWYLTGRGTVAGQEVRLLIPTTFMNRSGQSVGAIATFFKILPTEILVAHDELDLPPASFA